MTACRHQRTGPCVQCDSEDTFWRGGTDSTVRSRSSITIGDHLFVLDEGDPDPHRSGLTIRPASVLLSAFMTRIDWTGLRVLELGSGLGLPGMVAAGYGAKVTFAESEKAVACRLGDGLAANGIRAEIFADDWRKIDGEFDAIIGSECLFDKALIRSAFDICARKHTGRGPLLFADPGRRTVEILRESPLRGLVLTRRTLTGTHADGRRFAVDLWAHIPGETNTSIANVNVWPMPGVAV